MSGKAQFQPGSHKPALIEGPLTALSWLTIIPVQGATAFDRITGARVMVSLPVVGIFLGAVAAGLRWGFATLGTNYLLAGVLVVVALQLLTRFMHMDGLADVADALGSYAEPAKAREILADPHAGLIGMGSALLVLLSQAAAIAVLPWQLVFFMPVIGRWCTIIGVLEGFKPMKDTGFGALIVGTVKPWWWAAWLLVIMPALWVLGFSWPLVTAAVVLSVLTAVVLAKHCHKRFAGLNGDTCGFILEISSTVFVCVLACFSTFLLPLQ
ncbi:MAG: adenosylcobinamide-GDP ribazoletransferase [Corynebacterium sp.]|nr:adenosylcobinamide-GDP ribazoletransferase [Corynebacterium sp.]